MKLFVIVTETTCQESYQKEFKSIEDEAAVFLQ
jgi:hypothetical protein